MYKNDHKDFIKNRKYLKYMHKNEQDFTKTKIVPKIINFVKNSLETPDQKKISFFFLSYQFYQVVVA